MTSSEVELMETHRLSRSLVANLRSPNDFFGSRINGNWVNSGLVFLIAQPNDFFGSRINGNLQEPKYFAPASGGPMTSSEVELMETQTWPFRLR